MSAHLKSELNSGNSCVNLGLDEKKMKKKHNRRNFFFHFQKLKKNKIMTFFIFKIMKTSLSRLLVRF